MQLIITAHWEKDQEPTMYVSEGPVTPQVIEALKLAVDNLVCKK